MRRHQKSAYVLIIPFTERKIIAGTALFCSRGQWASSRVPPAAAQASPSSGIHSNVFLILLLLLFCWMLAPITCYLLSVTGVSARRVQWQPRWAGSSIGSPGHGTATRQILGLCWSYSPSGCHWQQESPVRSSPAWCYCSCLCASSSVRERSGWLSKVIEQIWLVDVGFSSTSYIINQI